MQATSRLHQTIYCRFPSKKGILVQQALLTTAAIVGLFESVRLQPSCAMVLRWLQRRRRATFYIETRDVVNSANIGAAGCQRWKSFAGSLASRLIVVLYTSGCSASCLRQGKGWSWAIWLTIFRKLRSQLILDKLGLVFACLSRCHSWLLAKRGRLIEVS